MATLKDIQKRFSSLAEREMDYVATALQDSEEVAASLIASQLAFGVKSDGDQSDYPYSPLTIALKKGKSGLSGVTAYLTNYDSGESYRKLYMRVEGEDVIFGTDTDKEDAISERMDGMAFRPTQENKEELIAQTVQPNFNKRIKEFLKL
jgi:hypothetical protein